MYANKNNLSAEGQNYFSKAYETVSEVGLLFSAELLLFLNMGTLQEVLLLQMHQKLISLLIVQ